MKFSYRTGLLQPSLQRAEHAWLVACGVLGGVLVLYATGLHGIALSNDSAFYLSAAQSLMRGQGPVDYAGTPLVVLAPFYSFVLGVVGWFLRTEPQPLAPWLNAFLYGGVVYVGGHIAFRLIETRWLAWATTFALVLASNLALVSVYAWSETLFIFFVMLAVGFAYRYLETQTRRALVCMVAAIVLAWFTRYAGLALLGWGVLVTSVLNPAERKIKLRDTLLLIGLCLVLPGLWVLRNYAASGTFFGPRPPSIFTLAENLGYTLYTFARWFVPVRFAGNTWLVLGLGIVGVSVSVAAWRLDVRPLKRFFVVQSPIMVLVLCYVVFLVVAATLTAMDEIGDRLLSPLYLPIMFLAAGWLDAIACSFSRKASRRVVQGALLLFVGLWLVYAGVAKYSLVRLLRVEGRGFTEKRWRTSPTLEYVRTHQDLPDCVIATNQSPAVYLTTGFTTENLPARKKYNSPEIVSADIESLRGKWPRHSKTCVIWFDVAQQYYFSPQELSRIAVMEELATFEDGAVYVVTRE